MAALLCRRPVRSALTPCRQCPRWCPLRTGRALGSCWTTDRNCCWTESSSPACEVSTCAAACCLSDLTYLAHSGITISGGELRLVSLADRATALQLLRFSLDRDGIDVTLEANFAMAGLGMEPLQLDRDVCAWRTEGSGKSVAMAGSATLRADGKPLVPERSFSLRWVWRWRSVAGQVIELARLVTVARSDSLADDPAPVAVDALARSRALGWRSVLAAHEAAWQERWDASNVVIEGDDEVQEALRFAVYHLTSAANPEDESVSVGARGLTGRCLFRPRVLGHRDLPPAILHSGLAGGGAGDADVPLSHATRGARERQPHMGWKGALYAWESADTGEETTPGTRRRTRRRDDRHPDRQDGAAHQRRYRLRGLAVLACDRRRWVLPAMPERRSYSRPRGSGRPAP